MLAPRTGPETLTPVYDESDYCGSAYRDYSNQNPSYKIAHLAP